MTYEKYLADIEELGEKKDSIPDFYRKRQINPDCMELGALRVDIEQGIPVELDELRSLDTGEEFYSEPNKMGDI